MANRRVVLKHSQSNSHTVADPPATTSDEKKRRNHKRKPPQEPSTNPTVIRVDSSSSNSSSEGQPPVKPRPQRKRQRTSSGSGSRVPRPEEVIEIDDSPTEEPPSTQSRETTESTASTRPQSDRAAMAQLDSDDYFEVLGLSRSATDADVKKAYRKLAVQWHPDKNRENPQLAEEYFKRIAEAYEVLSDPEKRRHYERFGKASPSGSTGSPDSREPHVYTSGFSSRHARDIFEAFFGGVDPFEAFFQSPHRGGGGQRRATYSGQSHGMMDPFGDDDFGFGSFGAFGGMPSVMAMMGGGVGGHRRGTFGHIGGGGFADAFFSDGLGAFSGGGGGFSSQSVSSSSYTDRHGHVVTTKTTTTTTPDGRTETTTEEFRNGKLTNSSSSSSRLAGAGRMQLEGGGAGSRGGSRTGSASSRRDRRH